MTKDKLWKLYSEKNPSFNGDGNVTLSARGLRKLFDQTWDMAYDAGAMQDEPEYIPPKTSAPMPEFFKSIFG